MAKIKLAAVSMIRNECDILELFIKINSRIFDAFYILDHHSSDASPLIIKKLLDNNYPIYYKRLPDVEYDQAKITTDAVRKIANKNLYDYIFPIDGDEFLFFNGDHSLKEVITSLLPSTRFGLIPWRTYCPISSNYLELDAPLYENFRMRKDEHVQFYKVVLGNEFAKNCNISMGNHFAENNQLNFEPIIMPLELQHVPIRSASQFMRKVLMTDHINNLRTNRKVGQSTHYDEMAKKIRDSNYQVNFDELQQIAINYSIPESLTKINSLVNEGPRIGLKGDVIEFRDLASISLIKSFDLFLSDVINQINSSPDRFLSYRFLLFKNLIWKNTPIWLKNFVKAIRKILNNLF